MERITETFRGVHCKRAAREWKNRMALDGWREETFSGVSGVGGYKTCSMTLSRPERAPIAPPPTQERHDENTMFKVYNALRRSGLDEQMATTAINGMQNDGILFRERVS